jgi:hypothetical protein
LIVGLTSGPLMPPGVAPLVRGWYRLSGVALPA